MIYINQPVEDGVILRREYKETAESWWEEVATNVPWNITYHSPTGFEWGYGGSGPADLSLNLAELVVQKAALVTAPGPHSSQLAWNAKQTVKNLLVANVPEPGGFIPWKLVCYAVMDSLKGPDPAMNRQRLQNYIDSL